MNSSTYIRHIVIALVASLSILLGSCKDEFLETPNIGDDSAIITISINSPVTACRDTRAMAPEDETNFDINTLQILVFEKKNEGEEERFIYNAEIVSRTTNSIKLKVPTGKTGYTYRFVALANTNNAVGRPKEAKVETLKRLTFATLGKWNTVEGSTPIPMWGETAIPIVVDGDKSIDIFLHRALARVDVGLKFSSTDTDNREAVDGLENFNLKDIRVYRTISSGHIGSLHELNTNGEVEKPSIPSGFKYNSNLGIEIENLDEADKSPLLYEISATEGVNSYIREIYIPESIGEGVNDVDEVPCIVIGGYYGEGNTTNTTYYRLDFAEYESSEEPSYIPILRNHRYRFNIKSVSEPGYNTPEEALKGFNKSMDIEVLNWNEVPLDHYTQGKYYVNVKEREITIDARGANITDSVKYEVPYETNLVLDGTDGRDFKFKWASDDPKFNVRADYENKKFIFTATSNIGEGAVSHSDVVTVEVENFKFDINVNQGVYNLKYSIKCENTKVNGKYREGVDMGYTNTITLEITGDDTTVGKEYEFKTVEVNGIYFYAKGIFENPIIEGSVYTFKVDLQAYGTLVNNTDDKFLSRFPVIVTSNSLLDDNSCKVIIPVAFKSKRILAIGANAWFKFGYQLEPNSGSRAFVDARVNFGTDRNSTVAMEEGDNGYAFTIKVLSNGSGDDDMFGEYFKEGQLKRIINDFKPDIILAGQAAYYDNTDTNSSVKVLADYVNAGGVFLMFNEYYPIPASIDAMVKAIMGDGVTGDHTAVGFSTPLVMTGSSSDPIMQGPFKDFTTNEFENGVVWGPDGTEMSGYKNLPVGTIIYTRKLGDQSEYACMFRHATKNFFFIGDGGFISNNQRYLGNSYPISTEYFPFAIDNRYRPVPKTNFGWGAPIKVHNSEIFGNILAWAVERSEIDIVTFPIEWDVN